MIVNADKRQFIHPHRFGDGLKLMEFGNSAGGTMTGLAILLAASNGSGYGGGLRFDSEVIGSWAGDRIAAVGDEVTPILPESFDPDPESIYFRCLDEGETLTEDAASEYAGLPIYRDISKHVRQCIEADGIYEFETAPPYGIVLRKLARYGYGESMPGTLRPDIVIQGG